MLVAQAISDASNSSGLSWWAAVAIYVLVPSAVVALIFGLVFKLGRHREHDGAQVLGHPADLLRHERDEPSSNRRPAAQTGGPLPAASAPDDVVVDRGDGEPTDEAAR